MKPPAATAEPTVGEEVTDLFRARRWPDAVRQLGRVLDPDASARRMLTLARNMQALAEHRPALHDQLADLAAEPGSIPAPPRGDALATAKLMARLAEAIAGQHPLGVYGVGDGRLFEALARENARSALGQCLCVHVVVEEPVELLAAMTAHDYAAPAGPIRQARFLFHVGRDWSSRLRSCFDAEPLTPFPAMGVAQGASGAAIQSVVSRIAVEMGAELQRLVAASRARYAAVPHAEWVALFGDTPPRRPRVLLFTSRYTTVLQHSTRDARDTFDTLGWDTRLIIEPADHLQLTQLAFARAVAGFAPDLVFIIDHLRCEYAGQFPPQLPMMSWAQDHLPNLTTPKAGASITRRDFVLTGPTPMYTLRWGYPRRQMIPQGKATRMSALPASWACDGDDLVYVSNASRPPRALADELVALVKTDARITRLTEAVTAGMIELYARDQSLPTPHDLSVYLDTAAARIGVGPIVGEQRAQIVRALVHPFNDALYRQQALRWASRIAKRRGLSMALYGKGWESHPELAEHARGSVAYGAELEALTRRSKINLQIVPFFCLHQRLLDGLAAGGFFLIRRYATDTLLGEIATFIDAHLGSEAIDTATARARVADDRRAELESLIQRGRLLSTLGEDIDPIAYTLAFREAEMIDAGRRALPHLDDVSFTDEASLERRIEAVIGDEGNRRRIAADQRSSIAGRLTYEASLARVMRKIGSLIADEDTP